ncbi:MAG: dTDP-L-rhamnose 4-epimerase [Mucilaginibacter sp.]|nr:dTDP-L-rhamnose 4-epimerase [Mucilaginibacter sp.]
MEKNILITGGAGFIGSNLTLNLIKKGHNVTVLDNLSKQIHGDNPKESSSLYKAIKNHVNFIEASVTSETQLLKAIKGQSIIVHLAAETGTGQSMFQIAHYSNINVGGTALLLDILTNTKHSVSKVVVASSRAIYGEGKYKSRELGVVYPNQREIEDLQKGDFEVKYKDCITPLVSVPTDEDAKVHPSSVYGITKQNQEQMVMTVCPAIDIAPVALRYQNVYGPGQSLSNPYTGILSIFSSLIKNNKEINIFEDGNETRDFVFIDDVVNATTLAIESEAANNEVFNVGTGVATDIITVAKELMKNYGKVVPYKVSGNYRIGDIRHNRADISKIRQLLGFQPSISFAEGIRKFCYWVNTQKMRADKYSQSLKEMKDKGLFK